MPKKKDWIKGATKRKGAFTKKAKKAGESVAAFAEEKKNADGKVGKQARLAIILMGMNKPKMKKAGMKAMYQEPSAKKRGRK